MQIIHSQVVDTAIVFPHRMGLPYKRALKTLAKEFLHKFIQNDIGKKDCKLEGVNKICSYNMICCLVG